MTHSIALRAITYLGLLACAPAFAQVTQRVSIAANGFEFDTPTELAGVSDDGRYVWFNNRRDGFLRDRRMGTTERVTLGTNGQQGNQPSKVGWITPGGRYVVFWSHASNLVPGDTNGQIDVFVRDRVLGTTERVSVSSTGVQGDDGGFLFSFGRSISDDGRFVCFVSYATNLVPGDGNGMIDTFVHDRQTGSTERVSISTGGGEGLPCDLPYYDAGVAEISADGRFVAFQSELRELVPFDTNCAHDVFVRDRQLGTTERMSVSTSGAQAVEHCLGSSISSDGRYVAFVSEDPLVPGDANGTRDAFVRDRTSNTIEVASLATGGAQANGWTMHATISNDGRYVGFASIATNLVAGDMAGTMDAFLRDRQNGTTELVSRSLDGNPGNDNSSAPLISANGRFVGFTSGANDLVPDDTNGTNDAYLRDRFGGTGFTSLCTPGAAGVLACPCSNPPGGLDRGCDNSSATGGAVLSASGGTFLTSDSLVFETSGQTPSGLSIVTQWASPNATGAIFGMGVRCTSGSVERLYTKTAVGGSITAPSFGAGEPQVSVRSAELGDTIQLAQSRWYVVYYRDPVVLGGCPASSNFNATQTGQVFWYP